MNVAPEITPTPKIWTVDDFTPQSFALVIEQTKKERQTNYLEAVSFLVEFYQFNYLEVPSIISPSIREKIEVDAKERHMLRD